MEILDNTSYKGENFKSLFSESNIKDLLIIENSTIGTLKKQKGVWVFPPDADKNNEKELEGKIITFQYSDAGAHDMEITKWICGLKTENILGFIGSGSTDLTIRSRFSKKERNDWFMQYLLQEVLSINIFTLNHSVSGKGSFDYRFFLFPYLLQKALRKGLYREYVRRLYNNDHPTGTIDVKQHILRNSNAPNGKVAYVKTEYAEDNPMAQLIRHTIESIRGNRMVSNILSSSQETIANVRTIINATPSYRKGELQKVINSCNKLKPHPVYTDYQPLQKLCLQILKNEELGYDGLAASDKTYGLLFDGAWLWEEFLGRIFTKAGYVHPKNGIKTDPIMMFKGIETDWNKRYPDYYKTGNSPIVIDAKYRPILKIDDKKGIITNYNRDHFNQILAYLHLLKSKKGCLIFPSEFTLTEQDDFTNIGVKTNLLLSKKELYVYKIGDLEGNGGSVFLIGVCIPSKMRSYEDFYTAMKNVELELLDTIKNKLPLY